MTTNSNPGPSPWTLAARTAKMNPSILRELLKLTERPGIISFAGGLPSAKTFPVAEFAAACAKVLHDDPAGALRRRTCTAPASTSA
jgi:2-aminoadipate transaminase